MPFFTLPSACCINNWVARLPPLFKRIHTYNDVMRDAADDGQVTIISHSDLDIAKMKKSFFHDFYI